MLYNILSLFSLGVHDQYDTIIYPSHGSLQSKDQKSLGQRAYEFGSKVFSKIMSSDSTKEQKEKGAVEEVAKPFPRTDFKVPAMSDICQRCLKVFTKDRMELLVSGVEASLNPDDFIHDIELIYNSFHVQVLHDGSPSKSHLHVTKLWKNPSIKQVLKYTLSVLVSLDQGIPIGEGMSLFDTLFIGKTKCPEYTYFRVSIIKGFCSTCN